MRTIIRGLIAAELLAVSLAALLALAACSGGPSASLQAEGVTLEVRVVDQDTLAFRSPTFG